MSLIYHLQSKQEFLSCFEQRKKRPFHMTRQPIECANNIIVYIHSTIIKSVPTSGPLYVLFLLDCSPLRYLQGTLLHFLQASARRSPSQQGHPWWPNLKEHCSLPLLLHVTLFSLMLLYFLHIIYRSPPDSWVKYTHVYLKHTHLFIVYAPPLTTVYNSKE